MDKQGKTGQEGERSMHRKGIFNRGNVASYQRESNYTILSQKFKHTNACFL